MTRALVRAIHEGRHDEVEARPDVARAYRALVWSKKHPSIPIATLRGDMPATLAAFFEVAEDELSEMARQAESRRVMAAGAAR